MRKISGLMIAAISMPILSGGASWTKLCNGRDLDGWEKVNTGGNWSVEQGMIVVRRTPPDRGASWLVTKKDYGDFILRLKYKSATGNYNSGILIRDPAHAKLFRPAYSGFEIIIAQGQNDENTNGAIYYAAQAYPQVLHAGEWADFEVRAIGDHIVTFMNGKKMAETHSRRSYKGGIGLHLHGGDEAAETWWKDIEIQELPPGPRPYQLDEEKLEAAPGPFVPLSANQAYGDFALSFDFKAEPGSSGGVAFRGTLLTLADDPQNPAGSIAGLARAFVLDPRLQKVLQPGQWNKARLYAMGDHLIAYVNSTKTAEAHANGGAAGPIEFRPGLGPKVEYRNILIKTLEPSQAWLPLFDGKTLDGWQVVNTGKWTVEDGQIVARRLPNDTRGGWLVTTADYSDFVVRLKFNPGSNTFNSGILIRDPGHAMISRPAFHGFEIQLYQGAFDPNTSGAIYDVARANPKRIEPQGWSDVEVRCQGDHIETFINGAKMAETHTRRSYSGAIGLQMHGGKDALEYRFKDIEIRELPAQPRPALLLEEELERDPSEFQNLDASRQYADFVLAFEALAPKSSEAFVSLGGLRIAVSGSPENPSGSVIGLAPGLLVSEWGTPIHMPDRWNSFRVYAKGDHVVTYVNLSKTVDVHAARVMDGSIVFPGGAESKVEFRNVQIKVIR